MTGTYQPQVGYLNAFNRLATAGTWTLFIVDGREPWPLSLLILRRFVAHLCGMSADHYTQTANIKAAERRRVLAELKQLAVDIGRCQETI